MSVIEKLAKPSHLINMNDIIREGHPTLRQVCDDVTFPLSDEEIILGEKMMQFLKNSQDPVTAEKMGLRGGVGLAAPQLNVSKRIIAVLVPNMEDKDGNPPKKLTACKKLCTIQKLLLTQFKTLLLLMVKVACLLTVSLKDTLFVILV